MRADPGSDLSVHAIEIQVGEAFRTHLRTDILHQAAETLLTYEKFNQWDKVWEMMHPDSQAAWESRSAFLNEFPQATSNLKSFELGKAKKLSSWTLPGTGKTYVIAHLIATLLAANPAAQPAPKSRRFRN